MYKILISSICLLVACERTSLSPVEVKIDNGIGGFATANTVNSTYLVANGETLFDIANKFNVDPMNLARINNIKAPYNVHQGQVLKLPITDEDANAENRQDQSKALYMPVDLDGNSSQDIKELDDRFEKMMKADTTKSNSEEKISETTVKAANSSGKADKGFNQQAQDLSAPKVTSTATGSKLNKKSSAVEVKEKERQATSSKKMVRPLDGKVISKFGDNLDGIPNDGINIKAPAGSPVKAISDGEVIYAGNNLDESFGNLVVVQHKDGVVSSYAHLKDVNVEKDAKISTGQKIGSVGKTGDVSSPQLHLEIMKNNTPENPEKYIGKI